MKFTVLKEKTTSEIYDLYGNLKKEQLNLRMQSLTGEKVDPSRIRKARREIAQIKTKLTQLNKA